MDKELILHTIADLLQREYVRLGTWQKVSEEYCLPKGTAHRIANEPGYCPRWLTRQINFITRRYRDLYATPPEMLRQQLENRQVIS